MHVPLAAFPSRLKAAFRPDSKDQIITPPQDALSSPNPGPVKGCSVLLLIDLSGPRHESSIPVPVQGDLRAPAFLRGAEALREALFLRLAAFFLLRAPFFLLRAAFFLLRGACSSAHFPSRW